MCKKHNNPYNLIYLGKKTYKRSEGSHEDCIVYLKEGNNIVAVETSSMNILLQRPKSSWGERSFETNRIRTAGGNTVPFKY